MPAEIQAVVCELFAAALSEDRDDCHGRLEDLMHSEELRGPRSLDHLRAFPWKRLRANAGSYLKDQKPDSYRIAQQHPAQVTSEAEQVKLFLTREGASPAPLLLERDDAAARQWRVRSLSL